MATVTFDEMVRRATGYTPYPYQRRIAHEGLPTLLRAPTGSGKTAAAVLPWLFRRRFHDDESVRTATPRWLVVALPLRTLVDQTESSVRSWFDNLGLDDVDVHVFLGGRGREARAWAEQPDRDSVVIGSIDMLLSRALNRGYAASRERWPVEFGMVNTGTQWVFDEVQLMGPALPTSRQMAAFREMLGTYLPSHSMWMSATVDPAWLRTVDSPTVESVVEIGPEDRIGSLGERLAATKAIRELPDNDDLPTAVVREHRRGTRTICFVNTVKAARELAAGIERSTDVPVVLIHSRFRPSDRVAASTRAVAEPGDPGLIVVTTQAMEAGVDVSSATLFTEAAPWASIVQRAGRCNRYGEVTDAVLWWYRPKQDAPYEPEQIGRATAALEAIDGQALTGEELSGLVDEEYPRYPVLRRKDVIELFDTTPTLSGDDTDISPYIRGDDERDVFVAWRDTGGTKPGDDDRVHREEVCRVPIGEVQGWLRRSDASAWRYDPVAGTWVRAGSGDLHPGLVVVVDTSAGGYTPDKGWDPKSRLPVPPVTIPVGEVYDTATDQAIGSDPLSHIGAWVTLGDHLDDTRRWARDLMVAFGGDLPGPVAEAVEWAAYLHDVGKAHPVFQAMLRASAGDDERPDATVLWAKSSKAKRARVERRGFRHELASALLVDQLVGLPAERDLIRYLVGAHHGKVRLAVRPTEDESASDSLIVLGVQEGDVLPPITLPDLQIPQTELHVGAVASMGGDGSWTRTALQLRDRPDLGVFKLGWLEAVVRLADWQASARPSRKQDVRGGADG